MSQVICPEPGSQLTVGSVTFAPAVQTSAPTSKELMELDLRRRQMARFPFCSDHRDKVHGLSCRECEIERLRGAMARAARRLENEGDEYGVAHELREALKTQNA